MLVRQKQRVEPVQQLVLERLNGDAVARLPGEDFRAGDGVDGHAVLPLAIELREPFPDMGQLERQRWRRLFGRRAV